LEFVRLPLPLLRVGRGRFFDRNIWPDFRVFRIQRQRFLEPQLGVRLDRVDRAFRLADPAIDAFVRVDDEHVLALVEAVHGANLHAIHQLALDAAFVDDVRGAAQKLVTSHLRLVTKIARDYRGYGLPISEAISEGNVGLIQAVERFEPEKGFRLATYAMWWIKATIQEYILRSWSLVKVGTTANQKKLFNLRKAQSKISILGDGDMRLDQVKIIARRIGVTETDVIYMNRRLSGDASLNAAIREDSDSGEWQDWLVDESPDQETTLAASEEFDNRRKTLSDALTVLNERERRIFEARRLAEDPITLEDLAAEFGVSRERVRQIEVRAFEKVQKAVKNRVAAMESPAPLPAH
jgi:RNA polymerase sigma-32 factor